MDYISFLFSDIYYLGIFAVIISFILAVNMFPAIIFLAKEKDLMAVPETRSTHSIKTPNLGGVGIFIAFSLSIMILGGLTNFGQLQLGQLLLLLAAITIMFFLGVKDDLIGISPKKKFVGQAMASIIVILLKDVRIHNLDGLFGIGELPYVISVLVTLLVFIFIINAFNLIDGIDGLAGSIAIIASTIFGFFFMLHGNYLLMLVSFILVGALLAFLKFNFSEKNKLFMGDSGSLFIGFLLVYQSISFMGMNTTETLWFTLPNKAVLVMAILALPILDTLRVFIIRISQKRSPFSADRNHIHHRLMNLGLSHKQCTLTLALANILVIVVAFFIRKIEINIQFFIIVTLVSMLGMLPFLLAREQGRIKLHAPKLKKA
ncbi:MAG TPA: MraY family glycosyltransferase [Aequorivita sp.]|nr:MraY family glycosyltransferase [Aequorivita sp.]